MSKQPHSWIRLTKTGFAYCARCGLVRLRNAATEKRIKAGCN